MPVARPRARCVLACLTPDHARLPRRRRLPVEPVRRAVGEVFGPVETGDRPRRSARSPPCPTGSGPTTTCEQRGRPSSRPRTPGSALATATTDYDRNRLAEYDGPDHRRRRPRLRAGPGPRRRARPRRSPSRRTVTIDAGSAAGLQPDMTVINNDGLVGRVLRVTRTTATVLLIVDTDSVVGGRVGQQHGGRLPARPRRPRRRRPPRPRARRPVGGPGQRRHGRDLGQRRRRAVRLRRAGRQGHQRLHQPARDLAARGDRARSSTSPRSTWSASWCPRAPAATGP